MQHEQTLFNLHRRYRMTPIKINIKLVSRTDLALLVNDGKREVWVPLSQIVETVVEPTGSMGLVEMTAIVVPEWVAQEKGLQASTEDDFTMDLFGDTHDIKAQS